MPSAKELLKKHNIIPRRRLGQSFLIDPNIHRKIAILSEAQGSDVILEIGSGLGILASLLSPFVDRVLALEIDPSLVSVLKAESSERNIEIIHQDFLQYDLNEPFARFGKKIKVIGNIPYYLSSEILFRLLDHRELIVLCVLMFQKEVADRISAKTGSKEYGITSVAISTFATVSREFVVPASCFHPKPKVDSAVVKIVFRDQPAFELADPQLFRRVVRCAFAHRRKTLHNNLKDSRLAPLDALESIFEQTGIDGRRRAETLSPEEFGKLSNYLHFSLI